MTISLTKPERGFGPWHEEINQNWTDIETAVNANEGAINDNEAAITALGFPDNVTITGGSITGITDLAIADGGTGASTAAAARENLLGAVNLYSLGGDFDSGDRVALTRIGNLRILTSVELSMHAAGTYAQSAVFLPAADRPAIFRPSVSAAGATSIEVVSVSFDGFLSVSYYDYNGGAVSKTRAQPFFAVWWV